jgi:hypothetical protein
MDAESITIKLVAELKKLRRGRGIGDVDVDEHIGPTLRMVCGVTDESPASVRDKVAARLSEWAQPLPEDIAVPVLAAFAVLPDAQQPFVQNRARWAGERIGRDERTVRRRIDEGITRIAELAVAEHLNVRSLDPDGPSKQWHTEELRALLDLDQATPEAFEFRRIVAGRDNLREIDLAVTLTGSAAGDESADPVLLDMDVLYGGTLVRRKMESTRRYGLSLALPRALAKEERHDFAVRFRVQGDGEPLQPHFVCVTEQGCDLLEIRVKFPEKKPQTSVWRLTRAFQGELDDPARRGDPVPVDGANELRVEFRRTEPGFAYGVQWDDGDSATG